MRTHYQRLYRLRVQSIPNPYRGSHFLLWAVAFLPSGGWLPVDLMVEPVVQAKRRRKARKEIHWHEGIPFASSALPTSLAMQLRTIVSEGEGLGLKTTRPSQRGLIFGWGRCARWGTNYKGTEELRSKVLKLQEESLQSDAVAALKSLALPLPLPETGSQQFFSRNYSPVNAPEYQWLGHPPPGPLCSSSATSCCQACDLCSLLWCGQCPNCPIHVDKGDKTMTIFLGWQSNDTPPELAAHFCCGAHSVSLRGGVIVVFDGAHCRHGVWAPSGAGTGLDDWYGTAFVGK